MDIALYFLDVYPRVSHVRLDWHCYALLSILSSLGKSEKLFSRLNRPLVNSGF
jgi:hypothetical protein